MKTQKSLELPPLNDVLRAIEAAVSARGHSLADFIKAQRIAESTWYRWQPDGRGAQQQPRYETLRDLLSAANRLPNTNRN